MHFCMSRRSAKIAFLHEPEPCKNTIFALRDSPKTVSGGKRFDLLRMQNISIRK